MSSDSTQSKTKGEVGSRDQTPRNYEKPRIIFREPLEVVAAACTPSPPGKGDLIQCTSPQS